MSAFDVRARHRHYRWGISGLATAYFLSKHGIRSTLIEKNDRLGGLIRTDVVDGCELEAGPDSFIATKPAVTELARELGIEDQIIGSNDDRRRIFLVRNGKLIQFPKGMVMMAPAEWGPALRSNLFSSKTKLRFLRETWMRPQIRTGDVSLKQFVSEHFGDEVSDVIAEPLLSGVYGGDAASLSARSVLPRFLDYERRFGSLIRGVRQEQKKKMPGSLFLSFRGGMQTLTDALRQALEGSSEIVSAEATQVVHENDAWRVHVKDRSFTAEHLVLACPAHRASALLRRAVPSLALELAAIPYSSAILVTLLYDRSELMHPLDGFGFLVPRSERRRVAAATWVSTKFPSRTPESRAALRAFIVGADADELQASSTKYLAQIARLEFERLMGIRALPIREIVNRWPQSMPQYVVGHEERCNRIENLRLQQQGLHLVGNAYGGVGIPDCVVRARETAKQITVGCRLRTMAKT